MTMVSSDRVAAVQGFVQARRKESGGYGATPLLPATVQDTYHALRIVKTLSNHGDFMPVLSPEQALRGYLDSVLQSTWMGARTTFQLLAAGRLAGVSVDAPKVSAYVAWRRTRTLDLAERYYCARIDTEILGRPLPTDGSPGKGDIGEWRDASELWMRLLLAAQCGPWSVRFRAQAVEWLQACQGCDGGYGFLPGTTSFIENCHTCLRALQLLGAVPRDPMACRDFVVACATGSGGFARINGATAFLDATWHALASLALLVAME